MSRFKSIRKAAKSHGRQSFHNNKKI
ncbi:hypothetical protein [Metallumcola ferriviriculae]